MFLNKDYLLNNETSKKLYHEYMAGLPVYDYHCHINPKEIHENKPYNNITEVWLGGDHYKWRQMRSNGVPEAYITGDKSPYEKFEKWCDTMPYALGNPLYHWSHLELKKYFHTDLVLSPKNAEAIWKITEKHFVDTKMAPQDIIKSSNVKLICTTDDPIDNLEYHQKINENPVEGVDVLPAFRPDKSFLIHKEPFLGWFAELKMVTGMAIQTFAEYKTAIETRIDFFHSMGCRLSDHALDPICYVDTDEATLEAIFTKAISGSEITMEEANAFISAMLVFYAEQYQKRNWVMQLHIGTIRNVNDVMAKKLGSDTGFDAVGDWQFANDLVAILNAINSNSGLPKTVLYNLNPKDNFTLGTIMGCFQGDECAGKIQFGSAWWFNDHIEGMERQIKDLANLGLLGRFIGMTTDSRSFLSYTRHDYFRRLVAKIIGEMVEDGLMPQDWELLKMTVQNIAYYNAVRYFNMGNVQNQLNA